MKDSIAKRIELVRSAETPEDLKKHMCPFYEKGGHPDCLTCRKTESDLEECRDYYLDRISLIPSDLWTEDFDRVIILERETKNLEDIVGIGINCDNCYMYDKCPLYKKGYACGIKWDTNKPETPSAFLDFLINTQYERVKRSAVFEKIDGGVPDAGLSNEMDRLSGLLATKVDLNRERFSMSIEASGAAKPEGGGILAKLFGGSAALPEKKAIEIPETPESRKDVGEVTEYVEVKEAERVPRKRKS